jgi:phage terminase large subunit
MYDAVKNNVFDPVGNPNGWFSEVLPVSATQAISAESIEEQRNVYVGLFGREIADLLIEQEFFCSFAGAMVGSYWGAEMARAEVEGRVRHVAVDHRYPVHTAWDLGKAANNPIWCFQVIPVFKQNERGADVYQRSELRIVDFYRPETEDLEEWCKWLNDRGYKGNDYVPHDIMNFQWGTKRTRYDLLKEMKRNPKIVGMVSVADGINAGRESIKVAVFDEERTEKGRDGLKSYRREWDDDLKTFRDNPVKDWAEHIGSSFRYLGLAWKDAMPDMAPPPKPTENVYEAKADGTIRSTQTVKEAVDAMVRRRRSGR